VTLKVRIGVQCVTGCFVLNVLDIGENIVCIKMRYVLHSSGIANHFYDAL